jgi:hypothetical protein
LHYTTTFYFKQALVLYNLIESDNLQRFYGKYINTENLTNIWGINVDTEIKSNKNEQLSLFGDWK